MQQREKHLIGAHFSIAGGMHHALIHARAVKATTAQIFTSNQKQWKAPHLSTETLQKWRETLSEIPIQKIMSHGSYLVNLGSNKEELLKKSQETFSEEIKRCLALGLSYLNFHPGSATGASEQECLDRIIDSLLQMEPLFENSAFRLLIETTAGQGTTVGHTFEHLRYLIQSVGNNVPIGVCIDTCHIFSAGYDIRTKEGWEKTLKLFDETVGLRHLYAIHVNDSLHGLGSRKDRHANLGEGEIGLESFKAMMQHPKLHHLPKYLETANGETRWKEEIDLLKEFASSSSRTD